MTALRIALTTAAAALALLMLGAAPASAAKPCWYQVQNDWYRHGAVKGTYPVHCYTEALHNLPTDSKIYSTAPDDIRRAMLLAIRTQRNGGGPGGPSAGPPSSSGGGGGTGFLGSVFDTFAPKNADGVPLPLIVLAVVAVLLLLAGAASVVARRMQSRRVAIAPHEPPHEPAP